MPSVKGKRSVTEALESGSSVRSILMSDHVASRPEYQHIIRIAKKQGVNVSIIPQSLFKTRHKHDHDQGVIAQVPDFEFKDLKSLIEHKDDFPLVLAVDHIEDPHNFGAIMRTCDCFGFKAIIFPKNRNVDLTASVIKASSGAVYHLNMIQVANIANSLKSLQQAGYWVYGTDMENSVPLNEFSPAFPLVVVMGNEGKGLSNRVADVCDQLISIPQEGNVSSLNVSVATGILTYNLSQEWNLNGRT